MKIRTLAALAVVLMSTTFAHAAWDAKAVAQQYLDQGYTRVEIKVGITQAKVEAIKGTTKLEVIIDLATGEVLRSETEATRAGENVTPGVFVRNDDDDFLGSGSDDDDGDDSEDDDATDDDDDDDDSDDDGDDDHGGDDDDSDDD
jgi:hypothetical protein